MYSAGFNRYIYFRENQGDLPVSNEGIVYIISNPAMPGLGKIGKTSNLESRMSSLYSSGVPLPFRCVYAKKVKDYSFVERKLHSGLRLARENMNREFFRIAEDEVINLLEMMPGEDVTPREDVFEDKEDIQKAYDDAHRILSSLDTDAKARFLNVVFYKLMMKEWEKTIQAGQTL